MGEDDEEDKAVNQESILQDVLEEYLGIENKEEAEEDEQPKEYIYTTKEACNTVQVLINYTEHQDSLTADYLRVLERLETALKGLQEQGKQQSTLDRWLI